MSAESAPSPGSPRSAAALEVTPVRSLLDRRRFLAFPWRIYAGDPLWVPPLLPDRARALDPRRGHFYKRGDVELFLARKAGRLAGTIFAAEDRAANAERSPDSCRQPAGSQPANPPGGRREALFGMFECVQDFEVARGLFARAAEWARARGLDRLVGPYNLDFEDSHGLLVEGRDRPPVLLCGHAPARYQGFLERLGFQPHGGDGLAYEIRLDQDNPAMRKLEKLARRIRRRGWVTLRTPDLRAWEAEVDVVRELLNRSLAHLPDFHPYPREAVEALIKPFRRIADPELILFAMVGGRNVGWFPGVPNLNEITIRLNGLRFPWDYLRVPLAARVRPRCLTVKSVLVLPEYWGSGAALLLFDEMARRARERGYEWVDLSQTSSDNPYTPYLADRFGARLYKRYRLYQAAVDTLTRSA
jgi:GNAT superfamily N-acetyltransferase